MAEISEGVRDQAWLRRERSRIARELHPDRGGDPRVYLEAIAALEAGVDGAGSRSPRGDRPVAVRRTVRGRVLGARRRLTAGTTIAGRSASRGVALGRRILRRPPRSSRVV
jgi:hypothetical protein